MNKPFFVGLIVITIFHFQQLDVRTLLIWAAVNVTGNTIRVKLTSQMVILDAEGAVAVHLLARDLALCKH